MKTIALPSLALALLALSACGEKAGDAAGGSGTALSNDAVAKAMDSVKLKPGTWETSIQVQDVKMLGFPSSVPVTQQEKLMRDQLASAEPIKYCVTPEEAEKPSAKFFAAQQGSDCTTSQLDIGEGVVNVRMECSGPNMPGLTSAVMKGSYNPGSYDIAMDMETRGLPNDGRIVIKARNVAKWVSEGCTDQPAG